MKENERIAWKVLVDHTPEVRAKFDHHLAPEIKMVCAAIDHVIVAEKTADSKLLQLPKESQTQQALCLALLRKSINDLLGATETFRAGYFDLAHGIIRSAIEGFATAILINSDRIIYQRYREKRHSVNDSVVYLLRRRDLGISKGEAEQIQKVYKRLSMMAHPTVISVAVAFPSDGSGFPIGGYFYLNMIPAYRRGLKEIEILARGIEGFLQLKFLGAVAI